MDNLTRQLPVNLLFRQRVHGLNAIKINLICLNRYFPQGKLSPLDKFPAPGKETPNSAAGFSRALTNYWLCQQAQVALSQGYSLVFPVSTARYSNSRKYLYF